jgi:AcrR family transcriptional regulator
MRITKEPEERRNEILDTAEILFAEKGYAKATVNDILQAIGIAKGTFYYYFKSKEEVMDAIVMRFVEEGVATAKAIASNSSLSAHEKVFMILMSQKPNTGRKEQMIEELHEAKNAEMHQKSLAETILRLSPVLTQVIEQGISEGAFSTPFPGESVEILLSSSEFLFDEGIFRWTPEEIRQKSAAFVWAIETMLGAKSGSFQYIVGMLQQSSSHQDKE